MDRLDVRIFLAMGTRNYIFQSGLSRQLNLRFIAKELGVDPDTVKARIKKMEESSFIQYYQVFPNFRLFGLQCVAIGLSFSDPTAKKEALQKLKLIEEVGWIDERLNSLRALLLCREAEADLVKKLALVEELTGVKPIRLNYLEMPPVQLELNLMDWMIIRSIRYDARKPTAQVAKELGLTPRGVNYRLQRLVKGNAFFIVPVINMENLENVIFSYLTFFLDENLRAEAIDAVTQLIGEKTMSRMVDSDGSAGFCVLNSNITESEEDYLKAKTIRGVEKVALDFPRRCHDISTCVDKLIDDKIAELEKTAKQAKE
jgi:DNA-binding Lrp family transcriptional regulator